jgi:hypothetical protein
MDEFYHQKGVEHALDHMCCSLSLVILGLLSGYTVGKDYGMSKPVNSIITEEGRQKNRWPAGKSFFDPIRFQRRERNMRCETSL